MALFILAEKRKQCVRYASALKGHTQHINRFITRVTDSKTRPDKPDIYLSYLQGHAYELKDAKAYNPKWKSWAYKYLPIFPKKFQHKLSAGFIRSAGGRRHMNMMNSIVDKCDEMWLGSDPDVEGEGLVYEPIDINGWRNKIKITGRIWIAHGLTDSGLAKTFHHDILDPAKTRPRAVASQARELADWLMGINMSRAATDIAKKYGYKGMFTAGRVQTPTLKLIKDRRDARKNFKPSTSYRIAFMDKNGLNFLGSVPATNDKGKPTTAPAMFKTKDEANQAIMNLSAVPTISSVTNQVRHQSAPKLPRTSDMQGYLVSHAHVSAKYAANKVLEPMYDEYSAQTYPRTECNLITTDDFNALKKKLPQYKALYEKIVGISLPDNIFTNMKPRKKYVDFSGKKIQKQGHGAITPDPDNKVMSYADYQKLNKPDQIDYKYVLGSTLAMFADDHAYKQLKVNAKSDKYIFDASSKSAAHNSTDWKQLFPWLEKKDKSKANDKEVPASDYHKGAQLAPNSQYSDSKGYYPKPKTTTPPPAINEARLVKTVMQHYHLGTSSTRASIIDSLKHTKSVKAASKKNDSQNLKKNELMPTKHGITTLELMSHTHLMNLSKVAAWQKQMDSIMEQKQSKATFLKGIKEAISDDIANMPKHKYQFTYKPQSGPQKYKGIQKKPTDVTCPKCHKGKVTLLNMQMLYKGTYVPIGFYVCSNKQCKFHCSANMSGVKVTPQVLRRAINGTSQYTKMHSYRRNTDFPAKIIWNGKKITYKFKPRKQHFDKEFNMKCPKCHIGHIALKTGKRKRDGKPYAGYVCTNRKCKFWQNRTVMKVKLTPMMIVEAIQGNMPWIQGTKKNGDPTTFKMVYEKGHKDLDIKWKN